MTVAAFLDCEPFIQTQTELVADGLNCLMLPLEYFQVRECSPSRISGVFVGYFVGEEFTGGCCRGVGAPHTPQLYEII